MTIKNVLIVCGTSGCGKSTAIELLYRMNQDIFHPVIDLDIDFKQRLLYGKFEQDLVKYLFGSDYQSIRNGSERAIRILIDDPDKCMLMESLAADTLIKSVMKMDESKTILIDAANYPLLKNCHSIFSGDQIWLDCDKSVRFQRLSKRIGDIQVANILDLQEKRYEGVKIPKDMIDCTYKEPGEIAKEILSISKNNRLHFK